jgi:hypothetical protein
MRRASLKRVRKRKKKEAISYISSYQTLTTDKNSKTYWARTKLKKSGRRYATIAVNLLTAIRVLAGTKNSRPVGFNSRNITKSTVNPNTTIHKYDHHGGAGAVCHS